MAKDLQETVRTTVKHALSEVGDSFNGAVGKRGGGLSGMKGIAAGAGAAVLVPLAVKNAGRLAQAVGIDGVADAVKSPVQGLGSKVAGGVGDKVGEKIDEAGGATGIIQSILPFGGGSGEDVRHDAGVPGVGKGRRMPVQQSIDIGAPVETVYNQWTQYEAWPAFMHRVTRVTQEDECTVSFETKIWGRSKEFTAQIETQRPDARVKWRVTEGITHQGVVTFHELGPNLTRVLLSMDLEPGGMLEKAARGMRHVKRAARADLHRFKSFIEMAEHETGAWRGVIEDGAVKRKHPRTYDRDRDYSDLDELMTDDDGDGGSGSSDGSGSGSGGGRSRSRGAHSDSSSGSRSGTSRRSSGGGSGRRQRSGHGR